MFFHQLLQGFANFINRCRMKEPPFSHNSPERFKARLDPGRRYPRPSGPVHRRFADPLTPLSTSRRQPLNPHRKPPSPRSSPCRLLGYSGWTTSALIPVHFAQPEIPWNALIIPLFPFYRGKAQFRSLNPLSIRNASRNRLVSYLWFM